MASSECFPAVDTETELNPSIDKDFQVDPVSSEVSTTKEIEERVGAKRLEEGEKKEVVQSFKTAVIVSGIVVAVAGAIFALARKMRVK